MKRFVCCIFIILLILPLLIGIAPSLQWGDTPLKTILPPVVITGKSTYKVLESRQIPIPSPFIPGTKERPSITVSYTGEPGIPEGNKRQPTPQTPGCAYRNSITTKVATLFKKDEAYDKRGKYLFLNRRYIEAIETFHHLIHAYPESLKVGEAYFWIGESYYQIDNIPKAMHNFEITVKTYPSSAYADYAIYSLGWISYRKKNFNEAIRHFKRGVFSYPESPIYSHMLFWLAESYMQNNKANKAYKYFSKFLDTSPGLSLKIPSLFEIAKIQFIRKNYRESKKTLKDLSALKIPKILIPKIYLLKGWCEYFTNDPNALETFSRVLKTTRLTHFLREEALYGKGLSAIQQQRPLLAEEIMNNMESSSPWFGEVNIELANYYFNKKNYKQAEKFCSRIFQDYSKTPYLEKAYMILGDSAYNTKDYSHAAEYYTHVILGKVKEYRQMAMFEKGLSFYQIGMFKDAIDSWEMLLKRYPDFERRQEVFYWLGSSYLNLHKENSAVSYFEKLKKNQKRYPDALMQLAKYWLSLQSWGNSLKVLKQFLVLYPTHPYTGYVKTMTGEAYFNLKDYNKASYWLLKGIKDPHTKNDRELKAKLYFILGQVYYREGETKQAISCFDTVSSKFPKSSFSDQALYWKSMSYYSQQAFKEAILSFKALIKAFPDSPLRAKATMKIADCYYNQKKYNLSYVYYQKVASTFRNKKIAEKANYGRVLSLYQKGDLPHFFSEAKGFLNSFPNSKLLLDVIQLIAEYYESKGEFNKEINLFEGFLKRKKGPLQTDAIRLKLAKLFARKELFDSAIVQLRLISERSPQSPFRDVAEKEMGEIYYNQKLYTEAIPHYRRYLASKNLPPSVTQNIREKLIYSLIQINKLKSAENEIKQGVKIYGLDWSASLYQELGEAYQQRKKYESALVFFKNAAMSYDNKIKCKAMISIAETYRKTKKYNKALKTLLMVRYTYPECHSSSERALLNLALLLGRKGKKEEAGRLFDMLIKSSHNEKIKRLAQKALNRLH